MKLLKVFSILFIVILLSSCAKKILHDSHAGERINRAEQNTDHLFKEME